MESLGFRSSVCVFGHRDDGSGEIIIHAESKVGIQGRGRSEQTIWHSSMERQKDDAMLNPPRG